MGLPLRACLISIGATGFVRDSADEANFFSELPFVGLFLRVCLILSGANGLCACFSGRAGIFSELYCGSLPRELPKFLDCGRIASPCRQLAFPGRIPPARFHTHRTNRSANLALRSVRMSAWRHMAVFRCLFGYWRAGVRLHLRYSRARGQVPTVFYSLHSIPFLFRLQGNSCAVSDKRLIKREDSVPPTPLHDADDRSFLPKRKRPCGLSDRLPAAVSPKQKSFIDRTPCKQPAPESGSRLPYWSDCGKNRTKIRLSDQKRNDAPTLITTGFERYLSNMGCHFRPAETSQLRATLKSKPPPIFKPAAHLPMSLAVKPTAG